MSLVADVVARPASPYATLELPEELRDLRVFDRETQPPVVEPVKVPAGMMNDEVLMQFVLLAVANNVSDLFFASDDFVFGRVSGMNVKFSTARLSDAQIRSLMQLLGGEVARGKLATNSDYDGRFEKIVSRGVTAQFRVNITRARVRGVANGLSITLRNIADTPKHISEMKLPTSLLRALFPNQGLVIVCGATGHGKTTLIAAVVATRQTYGVNQRGLSFEAPPEFSYGRLPDDHNPAIAQTCIPDDLPGFQAATRNLLRRAPEMVLIGESRDFETLDGTVVAALSGHFCMTTLHVETVHEAINRMISLYPADRQNAAAFQILGALRLIVVQRLVPLKAGGRIALRSWIEFDRPLKDALSEMPVEKWARYIRDLVEEKHQDMRHFAREAYRAGLISFAVFADEASLNSEERATERLKEGES